MVTEAARDIERVQVGSADIGKFEQGGHTGGNGGFGLEELRDVGFAHIEIFGQLDAHAGPGGGVGHGDDAGVAAVEATKRIDQIVTRSEGDEVHVGRARDAGRPAVAASGKRPTPDAVFAGQARDDAGARGRTAGETATLDSGAGGGGGGEVAAGVFEENFSVGAKVDEQGGRLVSE